MKKFIMVVLVVFCALSSAWATRDDNKHTDAHIHGHVIEKATGEHLPYVTIVLKGTTIGITTDATGHYFLRNLPEGTFALEVSMVGFKTITQEVTIVEKTTQEINFEMEDEAYTLDAVVVSANRNETTRRKSPSVVSVVDMKTLDATSSTSLADGLKFQPGLRIENNCQNCGTTQIRINGLEGPYSQILMDSRPMIGALSGVYALEQIPANMIERIEVVRGGGSALFGANAIGGIINVITREPIRNSGEFSHTLSSIGLSGALENTTAFNASLVNDTRTAGIMVYGQNRVRDGYDHDGDGFTEMAHLKGRSFGMRSYIKTGLYSKLTAEYQNMHEFRRGGDNLDAQPYEAYIAEQVEHYVNGGSLNYDFFSADSKHRTSVYSGMQHTLRHSYYGAGNPYLPLATMPAEKITTELIMANDQRLHSFGKTTELTYQVGGHHTYSMDMLWFMPAELLAGVEFAGSKLNDESGYREHPIHQKANTISGFLQNEWKTDMWGILLGARLDKHSMLSKPIFSPRINLRYNPQENINLRLTYSEGFRAPQLFDEDLHVDIAGGESVVRQFADNLIEERSHSVSGSADMFFQVDNVQFNILTELFYTRLNNPFVGTKRGNTIVVENSSNHVQVYGITLEGRMAYRSLVELQGGVTLQRSQYSSPVKWWEPETEEEIALDDVDPTKRMMRTPNSYAYMVLTYTPIKNFAATLSGNYTGSMLVPHEAGFGVAGVDRFSTVNTTKVSPDFFDFNLKLSYDFKLYEDVTLQVNGGIKNMFNSFQDDFDTGAGRASTYIYGPTTPRTVYAGIKLML